MATSTAKRKTSAAVKGKSKPKKPASKAKPSKPTASRSKGAAKPKLKSKTKPKLKSNAAKAQTKKSVPPKQTARKPEAKVEKKQVKTVSPKPAAAKQTPPVNPKTALRPIILPKVPPTKSLAELLPKVRPAVKGKPVAADFLLDLCRHIRDAVLPSVNAARGREASGTAHSGDVTFHIDKVAERALLTFLKDAKMPVAYYSEDSGYTTFAIGQPQYLLVVDPIDGTRAAKSGFEWCVVSVASTRVIERPTLRDVDNACVMEITADRAFYAERGKGAKILSGGGSKKGRLSKNTDLESLIWSMTVPGRPAELIFPTAAKLIDLSSLKGGFFGCNSTSYSLTRLLTHQLDAVLDFANRYLRDMPNAVADHFINAGRGATMGIAPYDIAASLLIAQEAGAYVTDAYGKSFDDVLLLDSSAANHRSMVAAANKELYHKLMAYVDTRIKQFEQLLARRLNA